MGLLEEALIGGVGAGIGVAVRNAKAASTPRGAASFVGVRLHRLGGGEGIPYGRARSRVRVARKPGVVVHRCL